MTSKPIDFSLRIRLGNEAMDDLDDLAAVLRAAAERLEAMDFPNAGPARIRDANGNTVGEFNFTYAEPAS